MSKKGLYRTDVAYMENYNSWDDGEAVTIYSEPTWIKGNIQPWRQGITNELIDAGFRFKDWRVLYTRGKPIATYTQPIPSDAIKGVTNVYYEGAWYNVVSEQDWSTQAKGVKHYELILERLDSPPSGVPNPVPVNNLVRDFERAVQELKQTTIIVEEQNNGY